MDRNRPDSGRWAHVAFLALFSGFYQAAIKAGENGAPELRPHYRPNYFAAFVLDPDNNNIEAVCCLLE